MPERRPALRKNAGFQYARFLAQPHHNRPAGVGVHEAHEHLAQSSRVRFVVDENDQRHGAGAQHTGVVPLACLLFAQRSPQLR